MKKILLVIALIMPLIYAYAQDDSEKKFGVSFSGFVKADIFYDTRQTIAVRNGHFLLYPADKNLDENGEDINAKGSFNILTIQSRLRVNVTGPDVLGAKTYAAIEGEFFGHTNNDVNEFRLRHAYIQLDWKKSQLLAGQYWNPMFITGCYPGTVSFNTGVPFLPFSRNPQVRYMLSAGPVNMYATAYSQVDFVSAGPIGPSCSYIRHTGIPALNFRVEFDKSNEAKGTAFLLGAAINYKSLLPQLATPQNYKDDETISSLSGTAFLKLKFKPVTFKAQATLGEDTFDFTMMGGYAVSDSLDKTMGFVRYTPFRTLAMWTDIHSNGKKIQVGLLAGYSQNMGTSDPIAGPIYARGSNLDNVFRIAPRFIYNVGKFRIAPEIEWDIANYGTLDPSGTVKDAEQVSNVRFLIGIYYFFNSDIL